MAGATYDYGPAPQQVLDRVAALQDQAAAQGMPLATAALHFARDHPAAAAVLLGTANSGDLAPQPGGPALAQVVMAQG
ncbi:hypothetical protein [Paracoccus sp. NBH48]|uniref:hypothetical protein n=1 Tax=Paracoccus sp. NBH48 TaxID=2596918 RepID=UPI0021057B7F|nr:hypothetical protein [Paracoccus sp. NBH48]